MRDRVLEAAPSLDASLWTRRRSRYTPWWAVRRYGGFAALTTEAEGKLQIA